LENDFDKDKRAAIKAGDRRRKETMMKCAVHVFFLCFFAADLVLSNANESYFDAVKAQEFVQHRSTRSKSFFHPKLAPKDGSSAKTLSPSEVIWPMTLPIFLFVPFYLADFPFRQAEHVQCLRANLANKFISRVYVLPESADVNNSSLFQHQKLFFLSSTYARQTFSNVFEAINRVTSVDGFHIPVVANSDIHFDESLSLLQKIRYSNVPVCMTLVRHDVIVDGSSAMLKLFDRDNSQDAWVFGPFPLATSLGQFGFGKPGCDNRLLFELREHGYCLLNIGLSIIARHVHVTNHRTYTQAEVVPGPYLQLPPGRLFVDADGMLLRP
jgi:hypothetical protein